jgi:hypothetical protein
MKCDNGKYSQCPEAVEPGHIMFFSKITRHKSYP